MPKNAVCDYEGCDIRAKYGSPQEEPRRCDSHILEGMMINPKTICDVHVTNDNGDQFPCGQQAIYGNRYAPKRCEYHKAAYTLNHVVNGKKCTTCGTVNLLTLAGVCLNDQKCFQRKYREMMEPLRKKQAEEDKMTTNRLIEENEKNDDHQANGKAGGLLCGIYKTINENENEQLQKPPPRTSAKPRKYTKDTKENKKGHFL
eukprot:817014-Prorocentrum_minimum.AAC.6